MTNLERLLRGDKATHNGNKVIKAYDYSYIPCKDNECIVIIVRYEKYIIANTVSEQSLEESLVFKHEEPKRPLIEVMKDYTLKELIECLSQISTLDKAAKQPHIDRFKYGGLADL